MRSSLYPKVILLLGSAPDVVQCRGWDRAMFDSVVAINNAWKVRDDWDHLVHAGDFPQVDMPAADQVRGRPIHSAKEYVPAQNLYGGFVYAGATMALTAAYWALENLKPNVIAFLGCDMQYGAGGPTHFYGAGNPDPLRPDVTLQSLEAKTGRLLITAARNGSLCVNLSNLPQSRLVFPRVTLQGLRDWTLVDVNCQVERLFERLDIGLISEAETRERALGYYFPTGMYWLYLDQIDGSRLKDLDGVWLAALGSNLPISPRYQCE
jgi:hypothetical protein